MKITITPDPETLAQVDMTLEITMTFGQWEIIKTALEKGRDGYFGPSQALVDGLRKIIKSYQERITQTEDK